MHLFINKPHPLDMPTRQVKRISSHCMNTGCSSPCITPQDFCFNSINQFWKVVLIIVTDITFPNGQDIPSQSDKLPGINFIPFLVCGNLFHPEFSICFRGTCIFAPFVTMPETAIHENDRPVSG